MRIRGLQAIIGSAAAVAAALLLSTAAFAHGGETYFTAEPTRVAPGSGIGVRADLLTSGPVRLSLAGADGTRREVGVVEQTDAGHFEVFVQIPADLPTGSWTLLAEADGVAIASTTIEVAGPPMGEETGGQGPRDEDDSLVVPLPSGWQAAGSGPATAARAAPLSSATEAIDVVPLVSLGVAVLALAVLVARTRSRGSPGGPSDRGR